ncbi:MAG: response regulator [Mariprofundales bacterium]
MKPLVMIVDDDSTLCRAMVQLFARNGIDSLAATSVAEAEALLAQMQFTHAVIDLNLGAGQPSGLALLKALHARQPACQALILTGFASIATAVEATKLGAIQYLLKPATITDIIRAFDRHGEAIRVAEAISEQPLSPRRMEWEHIQRVLMEHDGNISATAKALGIHRRTLQRKLHKRPPPR